MDRLDALLDDGLALVDHLLGMGLAEREERGYAVACELAGVVGELRHELIQRGLIDDRSQGVALPTASRRT